MNELPDGIIDIITVVSPIQLVTPECTAAYLVGAGVAVGRLLLPLVLLALGLPGLDGLAQPVQHLLRGAAHLSAVALLKIFL